MKSTYHPLEQETLEEQSPLKAKLGKFLGTWYSTLLIFCLLLLSILLLLWMLYPGAQGSAEKLGAGLLFVANNQVMLLLRNSKHNDNTWGLPGGNAEAGDKDFLATATREATEELGYLPRFDVLSEISLKRGKRQQKLFMVYICNVTSAAEEYTPQLNEEHHTFKWFDVIEAAELKNLHPVVAILFKDPARKQLAAAISADPPQQAGGQNVEKRGAGLFLMSDEGKQVLLLTRNSSNNNGTLTVPGGNVDLSDTQLQATAKREAVEEMGSCPEFEYKGEINTRRGKQDQKEFKIFLGTVSPKTKASFRPKLSHESSSWGWYPLDELTQPRSDLHPVVEILLRDHLQEVKAAFFSGPAGG